MRVLYVEDDLGLAQAVETMLIVDGHSCHLATTGEDAVRLAQVYDYDVILLDVALPDIDGYEVIRRLHDADVRKPVLIQSGLVPRKADPGAEFGFGVDDYLIKPFNRAELIKKLRQAIKRHKGQLDNERRRHQRQADWESAELVFADGSSAPCTIFSRSRGGAAIKVAKAAESWTKSYMLRMIDGTEKSCATCWQFGDKVGVRFI